MKMVSELKKDVADKADKCLIELEKTKQDFVKHIDSMIHEAEYEKKTANQEAENGLSTIKGILEVCSNMQKNINSPDGIGYEAVKTYRHAVPGIIECQRKKLSHVRSFQFPIFSMGESSAEHKLTHGEVTMMLPDYCCQPGPAKLTENHLAPKLISSTGTY